MEVSIKDLTTVVAKAIVTGYENTRELHTFEDVAKMNTVIKALTDYHDPEKEKNNLNIKELYVFLFKCLEAMQKNKAFSFDDANLIHTVAVKINKWLDENFEPKEKMETIQEESSSST